MSLSHFEWCIVLYLSFLLLLRGDLLTAIYSIHLFVFGFISPLSFTHTYLNSAIWIVLISMGIRFIIQTQAFGNYTYHHTVIPNSFQINFNRCLFIPCIRLILFTYPVSFHSYCSFIRTLLQEDQVSFGISFFFFSYSLTNSSYLWECSFHLIP